MQTKFVIITLLAVLVIVGLFIISRANIHASSTWSKFLLAGISLAFGTSASAASWDANEFVKFDANKGANMQVLIIGANGSVAKWAIEGFLQSTNANLKLYLRNSSRLAKVAQQNPQRIRLVEGSATDKNALKSAMKGVDVVYANLAGDLETMARAITEAMKETGVKRLIWISSYGVYQNEYREIPSGWGSGNGAPKEYVGSVKIIEASNLDYTIIRPQWFSSLDEIDYELTRKGEAFKNPDAQISRKSIAHLVIRLCLEPNFGVRESFGINKPAK